MRLGAIIRSLGLTIVEIPRLPLRSIYRKYHEFTMIPEDSYVKNLAIARQFRHVPGAIVECGVWKGGMSAGMAEVIGVDRHYYLFDSFEGCPKAQEIDGTKANDWQQDVTSPLYYNNSSADIGFSQEVMKRVGASRCSIIKGWFDQTLPGFRAEGGVAVLRLDADWYASTMICLEHLFPQVNEGGVIIIDDYYAFEGCALAVHDYLSRNQIAQRIQQLDNDVCFIVKARNPS
jgi:O-methyltransferase